MTPPSFICPICLKYATEAHLRKYHGWPAESPPYYIEYLAWSVDNQVSTNTGHFYAGLHLFRSDGSDAAALYYADNRATICKSMKDKEQLQIPL